MFIASTNYKHILINEGSKNKVINMNINNKLIDNYCIQNIQDSSDLKYIKNCNINSIWKLSYNKSTNTYGFINNQYSTYLGDNFKNEINPDLEVWNSSYNSIGQVLICFNKSNRVN